MINIFNKDSHIHFVNEKFIVINNPYNGHQPTIIKRTPGGPLEGDWVKIYSILKSMGMRLEGQPITRSDGLWSHGLKGEGDETRS